MLSCMYMAHAQGGGFNGFLKNSSSILSINPDTLDLGYRPAGAWMRPYTFTLTNTSAEVQITSMQLQGSGVDALNIDLGDLTLPFTLGENESVTLGITWGNQPASANGTLNVAYSNENGSGSANFAVMAQVYDPVIGDVWELAKEVNSLPFTETLSTSTNHEHLKYCAEEYSGGVGTGGSTVYWGIRFPAADLAAYAGQTLTKVGIFTDVDGDYGWTYSGNYTVNVYQGGTDAPGTLVSTVTEYLLGDMAWHDVTLTTPVAIDATQDLWLTFYTLDIAYPMSGCDYVGNPNSDFLTLDGVNWDHSTDYGLDYTWMIRGVVEDPGLHNNYVLPNPNVPDGNDVVYKLEFDHEVLLSASVTEGDNGKVALYAESFNGEGGPDANNSLSASSPFEAQIGEGTNTSGHVPMYYLYDNSLSLQLFLANELLEAGANTTPMSSISWYSQSTFGYLIHDVSIWMANVSDNTAPSSSPLGSSMTLVFQGDFQEVVGWNEFVFNQNEFAWDGNSNLLVMVQMNNGDWGSSI